MKLKDNIPDKEFRKLVIKSVLQYQQ